MRALTTSFSAALMAIVLIFLCGLRSYSPSRLQGDPLARPVATGDVTPGPAFLVFGGAVQVAGVPGGVAFVEGCSDKAVPMVRPHGTTLREVLDSITSGDSGYVWRINEGVVNLEPLHGSPALLRIHLKIYDSRNLTNAISAVTFLSSSSEVTRAATKLGLAHNVSGSALSGVGPGPPPPKKPLGILLRDVTLLDALNAIARANKHGVWTYREVHCGSVHQYDITFSE